MATKRAKKQSEKHAKVQEHQDRTTGLKLWGWILYWNAKSPTGPTHSYTNIKAALLAEGLKPELAREFLPANAFSRAIKKMEEDDRDVVLVNDDPSTSTIRFQFTKRYLNSLQKEVDYRKEAFLDLDTSSGRVSCPKHKDLEKLAQELLDKATAERTTNDVSNITKKILVSEAGDLIRFSDGVFFLPEEKQAAGDKVEGFLSRLGCSVSRFPVPMGTKSGDSGVQKGMVDYLHSLIEEHERDVDALNVHTRANHLKDQAQSIQDSRVKIEAYASYLADRQQELLDAVDVCKQRLEEKIQALAVERENMPEEDRPASGEDNGAKVLAAIDGEVMSFNEIVEASGLRPKQVRYAFLNSMVQKGVLVKEGRGWKKAKGE